MIVDVKEQILLPNVKCLYLTEHPTGICIKQI